MDETKRESGRFEFDSKFAKNWLCDSFVWGIYDIFKRDHFFDQPGGGFSTMPVNVLIFESVGR